jgi:hypothetical protein
MVIYLERRRPRYLLHETDTEQWNNQGKKIGTFHTSFA